MKFLFLALFLGVAQATIFTRSYDDRRDMDMMLRGTHRTESIGFWNRRDLRIPVTKDLVRIQVDIIKLLKNIHNMCTDRVVLDISKTYRLEDHIDRFMDRRVVMDLDRLYRIDGFLKRDKVFNVFEDVHRREVVTITKVLLGARDLGDFFKVACWLRNRVNGGVFTYALYVAVRNRIDCRGVILPPMYEIFPLRFFNNKVIQKATQLKMQGEIFDERYARTLGIERIDRDVYLLKTDYTGVNIHNDGEERLTYFTEDIGLNNNYFMTHVTMPFWLDYRTVTTRRDDFLRGERWIFIHEQLLARYYMERLSNGLGEIPRFKWNLPIKTGYNPSLRHHNGLEYSIRPNNYVVNTVDNLWDLKTYKDIEKRLRDVIDFGFVWTRDGKILTMSTRKDIDTLGNLLECNTAAVNKGYCRRINVIFKLLGNRRVIDDDTGLTPTVLESYETMLRDPIFYQLIKRILHNVHKFRDNLVPYTYDDLVFRGVVVKDVKVDKLVTFFDTFDVDITNVVNRDINEMTVNRDDMILKTRMVRLNHVPFNVDVDVLSDITTDCTVKIFLGPKYDGRKRKITDRDIRNNVLLLDTYTTTLRKGRNTITRNSRTFDLVTDDMMTTRKLIHRIDNCLKGVEECFTRVITHSVLIPDRLILPKGTHGGMTFRLFVTITPIRRDCVTDTTTTTTTTCLRDLRYPFDRRTVHDKIYKTIDNFFTRDVIIYHKEGIMDKYTGEVKDKLVSGSSESIETLRRNTFDMYGRRADSLENIYDRDTRTMRNDRTFDNTLTRRNDRTFDDTLTRRNDRTFDDTLTRRNDRTFDDTLTSRNDRTFYDTLTRRNDRTFDDTLTRRNDRTFDDTLTSRNDRTFYNTLTRRNDRTFDDTLTRRNDRTFDDTLTRRNDRTFDDTLTSRNDRTFYDTLTRRNDRTFDDTLTRRNDRTFDDTLTSRNDRTFYNTLTRRNDRTFDDTLTRRNDRTFDDTLTRRNDRTFDDTLTRRNDRTFDDTLTRRNDRTFYDTLTRRNDRTFDDTLTRRNDRTFDDTLTRRNDRTFYDTLTRRNDRTFDDTLTRRNDRTFDDSLTRRNDRTFDDTLTRRIDSREKLRGRTFDDIMDRRDSREDTRLKHNIYDTSDSMETRLGKTILKRDRTLVDSRMDDSRERFHKFL